MQHLCKELSRNKIKYRLLTITQVGLLCMYGEEEGECTKFGFFPWIIRVEIDERTKNGQPILKKVYILEHSDGELYEQQSSSNVNELIQFYIRQYIFVKIDE